MSHLKVTNLTGLDGNISNAPVKFTGDTVEFNSQTRPAPGTVVQSVVRMVRSPFSYSTGGAYYQYFAEIDCMRTKIKSRYDSSAFHITMWLNGEPQGTHDWTWAPARSFQDTDFNASDGDWHTDFFTHHEALSLGTQWQYYLGVGYTNPGNYDESNYSSTPIQTCSMFFTDSPGVSAGTDIWYTNFMMSSGNYTYYVNRCLNYVNNSTHETGVSGVRIDEIAGPCVRSTIQPGIEEYRFGDQYVTGDRTSANTSVKGVGSEQAITYPSR